MSRKAIIAIIVLMTAALLGVSIIQFFWIKWSLNLKERTFDDKVLFAMNRVKEQLLENTKAAPFLQEYQRELILRKKNEKISLYDKITRGRDDWEKQKLEYEIWSNMLLTDPTSFLEEIDKNKLAYYLKTELSNQGIALDYEYGVYSSKTESFLILNDNYVAEFGDETQATNVDNVAQLDPSEYRVSLFEYKASDEPGSLNLYFPRKQGFLWQDILPILLLSVLFTGLILFCFSYTIYVILRQRKISEIKTDFINNMTHEFKTPIATISLASDSISSPRIIHDESKVRRFINIIKEENKRMLSQVEKVLQMAKIDRKEIKLAATEIDMDTLVETACEHAQLKLDERGGSISVDYDATDAIIEGDKTHISNVLHNLLDNAEKYTTDVPEIKVRIHQDRKNLKVTIKDNGIGMGKDAVKHIFEKFYRVHTGNLHDVKGFGLGLSYVKAIVEAHGGTVSVQSEVGKGSSFTISLPRTLKKSK